MRALFRSSVFAVIAFGIALSAASGAEPDPKKMQTLAEQVLVASGNDARISAINRAFSTRQALTDALRVALPKSFSDQAITEAVETELRIQAEAFFKENVRIYATHFSEDQLKDMLTFYQSPGGKALVSETPNIFREKAAFGRQLGQEAIQRMIASACGKPSVCH